MYKISEIISMPVISLYESEFQGIVYNIVFDTKTKKVKQLCILNENDGIKRLLNVKDIYIIGKDCIFVKHKAMLELECSNDNVLNKYVSILNLPVYNLDGELLGKSTDIEINTKYNITNIVLADNNKINSSNIINIGKTTILTHDKSVKISTFRPRLKTIPTTLNDSKVILLSSISKKENINNNSHNISQNKVVTNPSYLTGRILTQDIVALNGELIAKKNSIINKDIVVKASLHGKLIEIYRYSTQKN